MNSPRLLTISFLALGFAAPAKAQNHVEGVASPIRGAAPVSGGYVPTHVVATQLPSTHSGLKPASPKHSGPVEAAQHHDERTGFIPTNGDFQVGNSAFSGWGFGGGGAYFFAPPVIATGPGFMPGGVPQPFGGVQGGPGGLMLPMPPDPNSGQAVARPRRPNPARGREMVEFGDRSFRSGNTKRAEERYQLALKSDSTSPTPYVHLAQVSIVRGDYQAAANHLRAALATKAGPAWLLNAADIQALYAEPGDFAKQLARIESHLQAHPGDRDAWFVLGAEWFLSGRTRQAADVFRRLNDRRADPALAAFLDASTPTRPPAN